MANDPVFSSRVTMNPQQARDDEHALQTSRAAAAPADPDRIVHREHWWSLPYGEAAPENVERFEFLEATEPPFPQSELIERDGLLYSRSSVMSNYRATVAVGRCRFTSHTDPSLESWKRAHERSRSGVFNQLNDAALDRLGGMSSAASLDAVGKDVAAYNERSLIQAAVRARREGSSERNSFVVDGVDKRCGPNSDGGAYSEGWNYIGEKPKPVGNPITYTKNELDEYGRPIKKR